MISHCVDQEFKVCPDSFPHSLQVPYFKDVVLDQVQLEVVLVEVLELNYRYRAKSLLDGRHNTERVAAEED